MKLHRPVHVLAAVAMLVATPLVAPSPSSAQRPRVPVAAGSIIEVTVAGVAGVPASATAVQVQLTVVTPAAAGYLSLFPCGVAPPTASTVNFQALETRSNSAIVKVGTSGKVCLLTSTSANLLLDVNGWFEGARMISTLTPTRVFDTRHGIGGGHLFAAGEVQHVRIAGVNGISSAASAAAINVTAVGPAASGYQTVFPCTAQVPPTSTVNTMATHTTANSAIVGLTNGEVCILSSVTTEAIVDVTGYIVASGGYQAVPPRRVMDTRSNLASGRLAAGAVARLALPADAAQAAAAALNVTAVASAQAGYITVYSCDAPRPVASNLNVDVNTAVAGFALAGIGAGGLVCLYTSVATDLIVDLSGWAPKGAGYSPVTPTRLLDTRTDFSNPDNTGVPSGTALTTWPWALRTSAASVPTETRNGMTCQVFDGYAVALTGGQYLSIDTQCVIFRRSRITTTGVVSNTSAMVQQAGANQLLEVSQSEFDGGPSHQRGIQGDYSDITVTSSEFTRFGQAGVEMNNRNATASLTVLGSYFYETKGWPRAYHVDGIQVGGARNVTIRNNTVLIEPYGAGNGDTSYVSNSALGLWAELGDVSGTVVVDSNLLAGGGRVIYIEQKSPYAWRGPVVITNNVFDLRFGNNGGIWGPLAPVGLPSQLTWTGNMWSNGVGISLQQALTLYP